jgi:hypothetical protein
MVEKMTAVWLIIITIVVCAAVPGLLIYMTTLPPAKLLAGVPLIDSANYLLATIR